MPGPQPSWATLAWGPLAVSPQPLSSLSSVFSSVPWDLGGLQNYEATLERINICIAMQCDTTEEIFTLGSDLLVHRSGWWCCGEHQRGVSRLCRDQLGLSRTAWLPPWPLAWCLSSGSEWVGQLRPKILASCPVLISLWLPLCLSRFPPPLCLSGGPQG